MIFPNSQFFFGAKYKVNTNTSKPKRSANGGPPVHSLYLANLAFSQFLNTWGVRPSITCAPQACCHHGHGGKCGMWDLKVL